MSFKRSRITRRLARVALAGFLGASLAAQAPAPPDYGRMAARPSPTWVRDAVVYEVFPRAFSPEANLVGVTRRLDDLKALGVTVLWLMPIHPISQKNHKGTFGSPYAVQDYYAINPTYGTKEDFRHLVQEAHRRSLKVIIDIVANHTGWDSVMMQTPAFYMRDAKGVIQSPMPDWADVADLNYDNPDLQQYMIDMLTYWVREFDLDGFRCDAAGFVPTAFWDRARTALDAVKPDLFLLDEWHTPDLLVKAFDVDYAWPLHATLTRVLQGELPASALRESWQEERASYPQGALHLRFSDNHDEKRAIVRFGERGALAASALMFTLDGVPLIYNGMEVGDTTESGGPALFEKLPVFWSIAERRPEFLRFYRALTALRAASPALRSTSLEWLGNSDEDRLVTFSRRAGGEEVLVAINLSTRPFRGIVDAAPWGWTDLTPGGSAATRVSVPALALDAWGVKIFKRAVK